MTDLPALEDDPWTRITLILRDRWASNPVSDEALIRARLVMITAGRLRPKALLFWGVPNAGKTALKVKLLRDISQKTFFPELTKSPVILMVEAPVEADEARFYEAVLQAGHQYVPSGNVRTLLRAVSAFLDELRPDVMILDEAGNLNAYVGARGNVCLNAIRRLCNVHRMALLGFGTAAAMTALQGDEQLENRFETFELRPLAPREFREFVELLTGAMPLKEPTSWSVSMLERAYELTGGYVGRASYLVQEASTQAVLSGSEHITEAILQSGELSNSLAALRHAGTRAGRRSRRHASR
ncbi:TniB family NTP-binding protein [Brevundimonas sp.]|uniref:TniB family NTP-binding protein n=1 Tax=Brevundimonas sp. TaxID=1871086 RepID=UPI0028998BCF|nr:TniB family NTP-binding protein [Brevundimonas sp.]